jgi:hypothetical protein
MGRTGFAIFTIGILLGLPLLYVASAQTLAGSLDPALCAGAVHDQMGCLARLVASFAAAPVVIVVAGIGMGIVVLLRARAASLSGLWGFLAMVLTVQALALVGTFAVQGGLVPPGIGVTDPLAAVLQSSSLWLLGAFILFLLLVPEWRGPAFLDIGLSLVAALAAIIVIAVGHSLNAPPVGYFLSLQQAIADTLGNVPNVDWIALGVFVTALAGIMAGRVLPEAE